VIPLGPYFERIGWSGPRAATIEVLEGLCLRHTASVPFENLDILLGRPVRLDLPSLSDKIVTRRRGGYCFEQNSVMQSVLTQLGFRVTPLGGRVRLGVAPDVSTARTHMILRVDLDDGPRVVDVGFGFTPTAPLRLQPGLEQTLHLSTYRFTREGALWTLEIDHGGGPARAFMPAYVFTEEPWLPIDYEVANHYTSTHPGSFFTQGPLVMRHDPGGGARYVLRGREWSVRRGADVETHSIGSPDAALQVLAERFGLPFPEGTRFRGLD
jgi:N-hydroxyarylamine O-acetyltransferase